MSTIVYCRLCGALCVSHVPSLKPMYHEYPGTTVACAGVNVPGLVGVGR